MIFIIPLLAIGAARALMTFPLPDMKPFNCQSCFSFWLTVAVMLMVDPVLIGLGFISYLLSDLIQIYESKN